MLEEWVPPFFTAMTIGTDVYLHRSTEATLQTSLEHGLYRANSLQPKRTYTTLSLPLNVAVSPSAALMPIFLLMGYMI